MLNILVPGSKIAFALALSAMPAVARRRFKEYHELRYWRGVTAPIRYDRAGLEHERAHYEHFFTAFFGLSKSDYDGLRLLDVGCGPCGSLEWADNACERVGLDPLADRYRRLAADTQAMTYCAAASETIPYPDRYFDSVSLFNSLDHVEDIGRTVREVKRVAARRILLIVEIGHSPTPTEPHHLDEGVATLFAPEFMPVLLRTAGVRPDHNLYGSLLDDVPFVSGKPGILCARLERAV